jgi:antitoxin (DNA-binding transcriptional repressor) of toxin-antitoxin stability system
VFPLADTSGVFKVECVIFFSQFYVLMTGMEPVHPVLFNATPKWGKKQGFFGCNGDSHRDSYNKNVQVSVAEAKNKLPALIKRAESGERVTICRRGSPVADLVRSEAPGRRKPKLGTLKGKIKILDPDWWKPMTEKETEAFLEGRY